MPVDSQVRSSKLQTPGNILTSSVLIRNEPSERHGYTFAALSAVAATEPATLPTVVTLRLGASATGGVSSAAPRSVSRRYRRRCYRRLSAKPYRLRLKPPAGPDPTLEALVRALRGKRTVRALLTRAV